MIQSQRQQTNHKQRVEMRVEFPLPQLDDRLNSLNNKADKLLQKVLVIQQQIQSYTQTQHKQLLPITECFSSSNIPQSMYAPRRKSFMQLNTQSQQHQLYIKKMVNLGKNKVRMIQSIEQHISVLENKFNNNSKTKEQLQLLLVKSNSRVQSSQQHQQTSQLTYLQQTSLQEEKRQLDLKFTHYNNHKHDILKQSKTERFSLRQQKSLMKKQKINKQQLNHHNNQLTITINSPRIISSSTSNYQQQQHPFLSSEQQAQSIQLQLFKLKQQFTNYQQRMSKQLQSYKQKLNSVMLEKEIVRKELDAERYDRLRDKLFTNNTKVNSGNNTSNNNISGLRRVLSYSTLGNNNYQNSNPNQLHEKTIVVDRKKFRKQQLQSTETSLKQHQSSQCEQHHLIVNKQYRQQIQRQEATNDMRNTHNETTNTHIDDLEKLREQLSIRYIEQNEQLSSLRQKLTEREQVIEQLKLKLTQYQCNLSKQRHLLQSNHHLYIQQLQELNKLLLQKQSLLHTQQQQLQQFTYQTNQYKQEIQEMGSFIIKIKEENDQLQQQVYQYKQVVEEFLEEVGGLREELVKKNNEIQQQWNELRQQRRVNNECQQQILVLKQSLQQHEHIIHNYQQQLSQKHFQIHSLQSSITALNQQKQLLQIKHQSFITSQQQLNQNSNDKDQQISELLMQNQMEKQHQQQLLHRIGRMDQLLLRQQERVEELMIQHTQEIQQLKRLNQLTISELNTQHINILRQKQQQLQQLQQSMMVLKSGISEQVQKQVDQAIRTFLRYRRHTSRLQSNTFKMIVYHNELYQTKEKVNNMIVQKSKTTNRYNNIYIRDSHKNNNSTSNNIANKLPQLTISLLTDTNNTPLPRDYNKKTSYNNNSMRNNHNQFTLRKLINERFKYRRNTNDNSVSKREKQQQLMVKMNVIIKLIDFTTEFLSQQLPTNKSTSKASSKKLPSLLPEHICIQRTSHILKQTQQSLTNQPPSIQETLTNFLLNISQYSFTLSPNQTTNRKSSKQCSKKDISLIYSSPEVLLSMNESEHSYTWTLGVIIDEMLNHKSYYSKIDDIISRKENYNFNNLQCYENTAIDSIKQILQQMLRKNFKQRPSLSSIHQQFMQIVNIKRNKQQKSNICFN